MIKMIKKFSIMIFLGCLFVCSVAAIKSGNPDTLPDTTTTPDQLPVADGGSFTPLPPPPPDTAPVCTNCDPKVICGVNAQLRSENLCGFISGLLYTCPVGTPGSFEMITCTNISCVKNNKNPSVSYWNGGGSNYCGIINAIWQSANVGCP
jgi:hypothetical protein